MGKGSREAAPCLSWEGKWDEQVPNSFWGSEIGKWYGRVMASKAEMNDRGDIFHNVMGRWVG